MTLDMDKGDFLKLLHENIDEDTGIQLFESLNTKLKPYKGLIKPSGFQLKRRRRMFESNSEMARIKGTLKTDLRQTVLTTHIGFDELTMKAIFGLLIFVYAGVLVVLLSTSAGDEISWFPLLILGHGLLIFGILYFVLRYQIRVSTRRFKRFLEEVLAKGQDE